MLNSMSLAALSSLSISLQMNSSESNQKRSPHWPHSIVYITLEIQALPEYLLYSQQKHFTCRRHETKCLLYCINDKQLGCDANNGSVQYWHIWMLEKELCSSLFILLFLMYCNRRGEGIEEVSDICHNN